MEQKPDYNPDTFWVAVQVLKGIEHSHRYDEWEFIPAAATFPWPTPLCRRCAFLAGLQQKDPEAFKVFMNYARVVG